MSLASLGSNYALRTDEPSAAAAGAGAAAAPGPIVPQNTIDALVRWIPAETITLYAVIISISNTSLSKGQALGVLAICVVVNIAAVWSIAVHRAVQTLNQGSTWFNEFPNHVPVWEIMLSSFALVAWISAIPGSWPQQLSFWNQWLGGVAIILTAVLIAFLSAQLNLSPPADQTKQ